MMNLVTMVGRISKLETEEATEEGEFEITTMTLAITRRFKNAEGIYETDFIKVQMLNNISKNVNEYCQKGDLVGIKGRLQVIDNQLCVVAEQVTFLSTKVNNGEVE
jgi:single-strand DNA-binding protein